MDIPCRAWIKTAGWPVCILICKTVIVSHASGTRWIEDGGGTCSVFWGGFPDFCHAGRVYGSSRCKGNWLSACRTSGFRNRGQDCGRQGNRRMNDCRDGENIRDDRTVRTGLSKAGKCRPAGVYDGRESGQDTGQRAVFLESSVKMTAAKIRIAPV